MFFKKKLDRIIDTKKEGLEKVPLEKNDIPAMIIAAFLVFVPAIIGVVGLFVLISLLFFR